MSENQPQYYPGWSPDAPVDWSLHNKGVTAVFEVDTISLFEADGRTPRIGADGKPLTVQQEFCTIKIAGDGLSEAVHPVDDAIKERFAGQYSKWKSKIEAAPDHPLEAAPYLTTKQVHELYANSINNEDDLAALSDGNVHSIHNGRALREKARARLQAMEAGAPMLKMAELNSALKAENEAMVRRIEKLELAAAAPRKLSAKRTVSAATRKRLSVSMKASNDARRAKREAAGTPTVAESVVLGREILASKKEEAEPA